MPRAAAKRKKAAASVAGRQSTGEGEGKVKGGTAAGSAAGRKRKAAAAYAKQRRERASGASSKRPRSTANAPLSESQPLAFTTASIKRVVYAATASGRNGSSGGAGARIGRLSKESLAVLSSCAKQFVAALAKKVAEAARNARTQKVRVLDVKKTTHTDLRFDFLQDLFAPSADEASSSSTLSLSSSLSSVAAGSSSKTALSSASSSSRAAPNIPDAVSLNDSVLGITSSEAAQWEDASSNGTGVVGGRAVLVLHDAMHHAAADGESLEQVQHDKVLEYEEAQYEDY
jgi:histone H3/H4